MNFLLKAKKLRIAAWIFAVLFSAVLFCGCSKTQNETRTITDIDSTSFVLLTLYSFDGNSERVFGIPVLGHAFVSITNNTQNDLSVYGYNLAPQKQMTVGTWGQSEYFGIWFNIEAIYMSIGRYKGVVSVSQKISVGTLDKINAFFPDADKWTPTDNCSQFAVNVWNIADNGNTITDIPGLMTPEKLAAAILDFDTSELNRQIDSFDDSAAYYKDGNLVFCRMAVN